MMNSETFILLFISVSGGLVCTYIIRQFALKFKIVNHPNRIVPQHLKPVAYLGGVGIFGGLSIGFAYLGLKSTLINFDLPYRALIFGSIAFLALGIIDDVKPLTAIQKFFLQFLISFICVLLGLQNSIFNHNLMDMVVSGFWIMFVVNAVNFTDVCDGLVSSIGTTIFLLLGILNGDPYCIVIGGAIAGFLFFNFPKASIFLGDAGSHLIGFLIGAAALLYSKNMNTADALLWMLLIPGITIFELIFITTVRIQKGLPFWKGSPDHFSLRLQKAGITRTQIDLMASALTFFLTLFACRLSHINQNLKYLLLILVLIFFAWSWKMLLRWNVNTI